MKYYETMPWLTLQYDSECLLQDQLEDALKANGLPTLIVLDPETGLIYNNDAIVNLYKDPLGDEFPWYD